MHRRTRLGPALAAAVVAAGLLAIPVASAAPSQAQETVTIDFSSSFEDADPAPTWSDTVEEVDGEKKTGGVTGQPTSGLPGSIMDSVVAVMASAENLPNEGVAKVVDGDANSKWLTFNSTGWVAGPAQRADRRPALRAHVGQRCTRARPEGLEAAGLAGRRHVGRCRPTDRPGLRGPVHDQRLPVQQRHAYTRTTGWTSRPTTAADSSSLPSCSSPTATRPRRR